MSLSPNFAESRGLPKPKLKTKMLHEILNDLDDIISQVHTSDHAATKARLGGLRQKLSAELELLSKEVAPDPTPEQPLPDTQPPTAEPSSSSAPSEQPKLV